MKLLVCSEGESVRLVFSLCGLSLMRKNNKLFPGLSQVSQVRGGALSHLLCQVLLHTEVCLIPK